MQDIDKLNLKKPLELKLENKANYIDANEFKQTSPYQVIYNKEKDKAMKVFSEKYTIETKNKSNVLSYPGTFYVKGTSTV